MGTVDPSSSVALVDSHVHFHTCYDPQTFLDGALRNFRKAGQAGTGNLLLTESAGAHWLRRWREGLKAPGWRFEPTSEEDSLRAVNGVGEGLVLIAGRQIVARERLEVLALGKDLDLADGLPLREVLERVRESGALPVLPWGFGKWWGQRGAVVTETLAMDGELFLGDNGGRLGPDPALFRRARKLGIRVLPGSDPLPFSRHAGLAGSYGFILPQAVDLDRPAATLLRRIRESGQPRAFGRRAGLPRFLRDQVGMQLRSAEVAS
jgi:hypothetical protein